MRWKISGAKVSSNCLFYGMEFKLEGAIDILSILEYLP